MTSGSATSKPSTTLTFMRTMKASDGELKYTLPSVGGMSASSTRGATNQPPVPAAVAMPSTQKIVARSSSRCSTKLITGRSAGARRPGRCGAAGGRGPAVGASGHIGLLLQQTAELFHELLEIAERAVDRREAHVGDFVERLQAVHHRFADV